MTVGSTRDRCAPLSVGGGDSDVGDNYEGGGDSDGGYGVAEARGGRFERL